MIRFILALVALLSLTACGAQSEWASDEAVARARYVHDGPPAITLYTVVSTRNNSGAHSGLMINGSERIMYDPAGTWHHPNLPERNDVHFGMTPKMVNFYIDYHARETFDVVEQTIVVTPEVAAIAAARAKAQGASPKALCANSVSSILRGVPGFEGLPRTFMPLKYMEAFGKLPGVTTRVIHDDDADNNHGVLMVQAGDPRLQ
jgi:hypothetical protein